MFWADAVYDRIWKSNLDGSGSVTQEVDAGALHLSPCMKNAPFKS